MTDILFNSLTWRGRGALQELGRRPLEANERGRVDAIGQISPDWADGSAVTDAESHCVDCVIEILKITLVKMQRHIAERAEDISHVMEDDALNVLPNEGESHFDIVKEKRIASQWKAGWLRSWTTWDQRRSHVSRPSLVVGKRAQ